MNEKKWEMLGYKKQKKTKLKAHKEEWFLFILIYMHQFNNAY